MLNSIDFSTWDELLKRYVDAGGRVDYRRWKAEGADVLSNWLGTLADVDLAAMTDADARLALWLNAYNAIAISQVIEVYPIASIRPKILGIPNWLGFLEFFTRSNSSVGCPLLRRGAYFPSAVRTQLEADASSFIKNPDKVRYDAGKNTLYLSKIFEWYGEDFVKNAGSVAAYVGGYLGPEVGVTDEWAIVFLPYDWNLNQIEN
ncbi:MAG: DUF547 domain-containing protein [Oscillatoriales cyanobacterium]|nr:MAG: DUF547 domain-containing protein [Oscillatoriales cyanobacterium]